MLKLIKISDVSKKFEISTRTIRYYEELSLIASIRDEDSNYRYFDLENLKLLEQILVLKKLNLSIKEIKELLQKEELEFLIKCLVKKTTDIQEDLENLDKTNNFLDFFIRELKEGKDFSLKKLKILEEEFFLNNKEAVKMKLKNREVRILDLKAMKVLSYRAFSESPEKDAWNYVFDYLKKYNLEKSDMRYFGFDNPSPSGKDNKYGYELCFAIPEKFENKEKEIKLKNFEGGKYAVSSCFLSEIGETWKAMCEWIKESGYDFDKRQCLEEVLNPVSSLHTANTQLDIFCSIKEK